MIKTLTRPSPASMTAVERREESFLLVDEIKAAIAAGRTFTNANVSAFFVNMRNILSRYGPNAHVSPGQLGALRKVARVMKGKRK